MRTGRPKAALMVSAEQREELERWVRRRSTAQALALRARIILSCAEGGNVPVNVGDHRDRVHGYASSSSLLTLTATRACFLAGRLTSAVNGHVTNLRGRRLLLPKRQPPRAEAEKQAQGRVEPGVPHRKSGSLH
jgi:hypothetical protein